MATTKRLHTGDRIEPTTFIAIDGTRATVPAGAGRVHLQFRRFAACPICNMHLRGYAQRHTDIEAAGITEVVFFYSADEHLRGYPAQLPFAVVADPDRVHYRRYGVEIGLRSVANPRAWLAGVRGSVTALSRRNDPTVAGVGFGDGSTHLGLPADFLVDTDGTLAAVHYGQHADDQWSVDELLEINRSQSKP